MMTGNGKVNILTEDHVLRNHSDKPSLNSLKINQLQPTNPVQSNKERKKEKKERN